MPAVPAPAPRRGGRPVVSPARRRPPREQPRPRGGRTARDPTPRRVGRGGSVRHPRPRTRLRRPPREEPSRPPRTSRAAPERRRGARLFPPAPHAQRDPPVRRASSVTGPARRSAVASANRVFQRFRPREGRAAGCSRWRRVSAGSAEAFAEVEGPGSGGVQRLRPVGGGAAVGPFPESAAAEFVFVVAFPLRPLGLLDGRETGSHARRFLLAPARPERGVERGEDRGLTRPADGEIRQFGERLLHPSGPEVGLREGERVFSASGAGEAAAGRSGWRRVSAGSAEAFAEVEGRGSGSVQRFRPVGGGAAVGALPESAAPSSCSLSRSHCARSASSTAARQVRTLAASSSRPLARSAAWSAARTVA